MKLNRQLHLWIGLICTVFILMESVTGFLMLTPTLLGGQEGRPMQMNQTSTTQGSTANGATGSTQANAAQSAEGTTAKSSVDGSTGNTSQSGTVPAAKGANQSQANGTNQQVTNTSGVQQNTPSQMGQRPEGKEAGAMGFVKNLHKGKIGSTDITLLLQSSSIGMVVLCITGIIMSVRILSAQRRGRLKRKAAVSA